MPRRIGTPTLEGIFERVRVDPDSGCWIWTLSLDGRGYPKVGRSRGPGRGTQFWTVHRLAYELWTGRKLPRNLDVHHICEQKLCVNPQHLEAVTRAEHHGKSGRHPDHMRAPLLALGRDLH